MSIRKRKNYRSIKFFNKAYLDLTKKICCKYGLKNKKEYFKAQGILAKLKRNLRLNTTNSPIFVQTIKKLRAFGIIEDSNPLNQKALLEIIELVQSLKVESILDLRIQSLTAKKFNISLHFARQLITHGKVWVCFEDKKILIRRPSFLVRKKYTILKKGCNEV